MVNCCFCGEEIEGVIDLYEIAILHHSLTDGHVTRFSYVTCGCRDKDDVSQILTDLNIDHEIEEVEDNDTHHSNDR